MRLIQLRLATLRFLPVSFHASRRELLLPPVEISNFTGREGNDVREAPHHSPR